MNRENHSKCPKGNKNNLGREAVFATTKSPLVAKAAVTAPAEPNGAF